MSRKLKAVWIYDAQQDLRSQHNLDAEAQLTDILGEEIFTQIDQEIISELANFKFNAIRKSKKRILPRSIEDDWEVSRFD
jgi:plasmid replication initiation protein